MLKPSNIEKNTPWAFFNGASQGESPLGGVGSILFLDDSKNLEIPFSLGQGTNNKAELSALWSVLLNSFWKECVKPSDIWRLKTDYWLHLLRAISSQKERFESISFQHICRELNAEIDKLSKDALLLPPGIMEIKDYENNLLVNQYVRLWQRYNTHLITFMEDMYDHLVNFCKSCGNLCKPFFGIKAFMYDSKG